MRNKPLPGLCKKSPMRQEESISDSTSGRHNIRPVEIVEKKREKPGIKQPDPGIIYDPTKKRLDAMMQANPLATLFTGRKTSS